MHVVVAQTVFRQGVHIGGLDRAAVAAELPKADIVQDNEQYVRSAFFGAFWLWPGLHRGVERTPDDTVEGSSGLILF